MKINNTALLILMLLSLSAFSQSKDDIINSINHTEDQFNNKGQFTNTKDYIIIYVPGANNPFEKIYDRLKGKKTKSNVIIVGGFKEIITNLECEKKTDHLKEAFISRYGKSHFSIFMDCNSKIEDYLKTKGYCIIKLSKTQKKAEIISFDFNRALFLKTLNKYISH